MALAQFSTMCLAADPYRFLLRMSGTRPMVLIACARNIVSASSAQLARCSRPMPSQSRGWAPGGHATGAKSAPRLSRQ